MEPTTVLTIAGVIISGLFGLVWHFFTKKIESQDNAVKELDIRQDKAIKELAHSISQAEKDINMAHNQISVLKAEAATKVQLNETVEKVRADIKGEFDRNEQRQEKREAYLKETLDKMYDMLMDMAKRIKD